MLNSSQHTPRNMLLIAGTAQHQIRAAGAKPISASSSSAYIWKNDLSAANSDRPSPSTSTDTAVGSCPATAFHARQASTKAMSWIDGSALHWGNVPAAVAVAA